MHNLACQYFQCDDSYFCSACLGTILTSDVDPLMSKLWRTEGKKAVAQTRELSWFTTLQSEKLFARYLHSQGVQKPASLDLVIYCSAMTADLSYNLSDQMPHVQPRNFNSAGMTILAGSLRKRWRKK